MKWPNQRYHDDPHFRRLVDTLYQNIVNTNFTPTEIREAAMIAQIKYEMSHPRPVCVSPDLLAELDRNRDEWNRKKGSE